MTLRFNRDPYWSGYFVLLNDKRIGFIYRRKDRPGKWIHQLSGYGRMGPVLLAYKELGMSRDHCYRESNKLNELKAWVRKEMTEERVQRISDAIDYCVRHEARFAADYAKACAQTHP